MSYSSESAAPFWSPLGRIQRSTFILRSAVLIALAFGVLVWAGGPETASVRAWLLMIVLGVLGIFQSITRGRDAGWPWWLTIIVSILLSGFSLLVLMVWPSKRD
jgi:uncharacterized membrane protein YhaH (DUF805 family)